MLVSFIIPAFNASDTIIRCLDSIYKRLPLKSEDFEVIVIDDCSSDNTAEIVKNYSFGYANLSLLVQPNNHRAGSARNRGLSIARGKYISFVDSDDEVDVGFSSAILTAETSSLEMVAIKTQKYYSDNEIAHLYELPYSPDAVFSGITLQTEHPFWCTAVWGYLYLKDFIQRVGYPFAEDVLYEDSDFVSVHLYYANRVGYCDECCYLQHDNPSSITHTISSQHVSDYAFLGTRVLGLYNRLDDRETQFAQSILEGGSYIIMRSCKNLLKLSNCSEIRAFYDRFDSLADRRSLFFYRLPSYCWTFWTRFCIKHKRLTTMIVGFFLSTGLVKIIRKVF
jgi:glycosyltransferase involved in cell wall biosynthesis